MALRRYAGRRLSSDQLDDLVLRATDDAGLAAIKGAAWTLYSDLEDHFADGSHSLSTTQKKDIARWIVFLKSDSEYAYPKRSPEAYALARFFSLPLNLLSFGAFGRWLASKDRAFADAGDLSVWPFADRRQLRAAMERLDNLRRGTG